MLGLLMGFGLSKRIAQLVAYVAIPLLILLVLWLALVAYGNSRFKAGEQAADAKWIEAGRRLEEQARQSADAATKNEAPRIRDRLDQVAEEKERIDAAVAAGTSPFDALFPLAGGVYPREDDSYGD